MIKIPMIDANDFRQSMAIEGNPYTLHLAWNSYAQLWSLSIEDRNRDTILAGLRMVDNAYLLWNYHHLAVPAGEFIATGPTGRMDFVAGRSSLYYLTKGEVDGAV